MARNRAKMGWGLLLLMVVAVLSACSRTAKEDDWTLTGTFDVPATAADGTRFHYPMRGVEGRYGFIDAPFVAGQGQKYMWHFWGEPAKLVGKRLKVVAASRTGETLTLFEGELGGSNNGAAAHTPSIMSLPAPGLWQLKVHVGEELLGQIVVEAVAAPGDPVACNETPAQDRWPEDYGRMRGQNAIWMGGAPSVGQQNKVVWRVVGAVQKLEIKARRLDGPGAFTTVVSDRVMPNGRDYYPTYWDSVSSLTFPTAGCWELDLVAGEAHEQITLKVSSRDGERPVVTTDEQVRFPEGCTTERVVAILTGFVDAVNQGKTQEVLAHFGAGFQWYSAPAGGTKEQKADSIYSVTNLGAYFSQRITHGERMRLQKIRITGRDHLGGVDFAMNLHRTADDLQWGAGDVGGKGAVDCANGTILVWILGTEAPLL